MASLGVNIDHIANVRQARLTDEPDPVQLAFLAELGGADGITVHLREDRRHIQERDLKLLKETIHTHLNLEMAATAEMVDLAINTRPQMVTIVPEKRNEVTTEGGLNVINNQKHLKNIIKAIQSEGIETSLFIDAIPDQIEASKEVETGWIELHTGCYANALGAHKGIELAKIKEAVERASSLGMHINAGHGLTYQNVEPIASIKSIRELNIGHTIISRALAVGLERAVKDMKALIQNPREDHFVLT